MYLNELWKGVGDGEGVGREGGGSFQDAEAVAEVSLPSCGLGLWRLEGPRWSGICGRAEIVFTCACIYVSSAHPLPTFEAEIVPVNAAPSTGRGTQ